MPIKAKKNAGGRGTNPKNPPIGVNGTSIAKLMTLRSIIVRYLLGLLL